MVLRRPVEVAQYTSLTFGRRLAEFGLVPSMSRTANCCDNAVAESFFATLKRELVDRPDRAPWPTRAAARLAIFDYVESSARQPSSAPALMRDGTTRTHCPVSSPIMFSSSSMLPGGWPDAPGSPGRYHRAQAWRPVRPSPIVPPGPR